jgi:outer membrane protein assembly factor BamB
MFTNLKNMNNLKIKLLIGILCLLLMNTIKARTTSNKRDSIITQISLFDGKAYFGSFGQKIYKLNTYCIWAEDVSKSTFDKILGKEIRVTGKFIKVRGKTMVTKNSKGEDIYIPSNDYFSFIMNPKFILLKNSYKNE